ncbi:MAG: hypothetical protein OHK93_000900 [Ramalina farinacea]|uniref:Acyltransferase PapA5 n=1 Tax=Ramalina farinacea TaxID=258253 RepID=A0AA43QNF7_9LECA|nr:hypothetical protein [Ramalina farinacea]
MTWVKKRPGRYERPLDSMETFHKAYGAIGHGFNREHFSCTAAVEFHTEMDSHTLIDILRLAWQKMRFTYPQLAAYTEKDTFIYEVPDGEALEVWLAATLRIESSTQTRNDLIASFKPQQLASLHYLPSNSEILFHTPHWRIDGVGTLQLLDSLFMAMSDPVSVTFGDEVRNLTVGLDEAAQVPKEKTQAMIEASAALLNQFLDNLPSIGLATPSDRLPAATRWVTTELMPQTTTAIAAACKANEFSVTAAIHAAVVCATQAMADPARQSDKYTTFTFFDLRKHLAPIYQGKSHAMSVCHIGLPATFRPTNFAHNARELKRIYARPLSAPGENNIFDILPSYVGMVTDMVSGPPPPGMLPATEGNFSSVGSVDAYLKPSYGTIEITDLWLGVEMLTQIPMVHAWTRQGRMKFNVSYNESFFSPEVAQLFLDAVVTTLSQGLGVADEGTTPRPRL